MARFIEMIDARVELATEVAIAAVAFGIVMSGGMAFVALTASALTV